MSDANRPYGARPGEESDPALQEAGTVHVFETSTRTRVVLCGEIDAAMGPDLLDAATDAEVTGRPVDVDARHVTFMDSSGVTLLARLATRTPGRLRVIGAPDVVLFLLDVTHLADLVDVVDAEHGSGPNDPSEPRYEPTGHRPGIVA